MAFLNNGFSVLAWVRPDSSLIADVSDDTAKRIKEQLLNDFNILLSVRWNMEMQKLNIDGHDYAYGTNTRITVSNRTISNAIGELHNHVEFLRGQAKSTAYDLANYRQCQLKWKVPDVVSDTTYGSEGSELPATSMFLKRKRT